MVLLPWEPPVQAGVFCSCSSLQRADDCQKDHEPSSDMQLVALHLRPVMHAALLPRSPCWDAMGPEAAFNEWYLPVLSQP